VSKQNRKTTERKQVNGLDVKPNEIKHVVTNKQQNLKIRTFQAAARVVGQVATVKTFLSSFKKDSEYIMVEIPKRLDGK